MFEKIELLFHFCEYKTLKKMSHYVFIAFCSEYCQQMSINFYIVQFFNSIFIRFFLLCQYGIVIYQFRGGRSEDKFHVFEQIP